MRDCSLDLRIGWDGTELVVTDLDGDVQSRVPLPFAEKELKSIADALGAPRGGRDGRRVDAAVEPGSSPDPREIGGRLFATLLSGDVLRRFDERRGSAGEGGVRLRLRFELPPSHAWVIGLPWELVGGPSGFLGLDRSTPLVRGLEASRPVDSQPPPRALRILVVGGGAPSGDLDVDGERAGLDRAWASRAGVEIVDLEQPTLDELRERLLEGFHVLHFMGHGTFDRQSGEGSLVFPSRPVLSQHRGIEVRGSELAAKLAGVRPLRLAVLNACWTAASHDAKGEHPFAGVAAALVRAGVPAVVAMQVPISDRAALAFSRGLYRRLAAGEPVDLAMVEGRQAIHAAATDERGTPSCPGPWEWTTPILFLRGTDGRLWEGRAEEDDALLGRYLERVREENRELELPALRGYEHRPRIELGSVFVGLVGGPSTRERSAIAPGRRLESLDVDELTAAEQYRAIWGTLERLTRGGPGATGSGEPGPAEAETPPLPLADASQAHPRLVLLGDPGSGKSTLLRRQAAELAELEKPSETATETETVPILVGLAAFAAARRGRPGLRLAEHVGHHLRTAVDARGAAIDPVELNRVLRLRLADGRAVVLLDGLDEVGDAEERLAVAREVDAFLDAFLPPAGAGGGNGCRAIVTSRPAGYGLAPLSPRATHLAIAPFDAAAIARFCTLWLAALDRSGRGEEPSTEETATAVAGDAAELVGALAELARRGAGELTSNPLLLSVLVVVFWHGRHRLPSRRLELYRLAVETLTDRWLRRRSVAAPAIEAGPVSKLLSDLAAEVHRSPTLGTIGAEDLTLWLARSLPPERVAPFDEALRLESGLLVERGTGAYGFLHLAFQQYLAARWLTGEGDPAPRLRAHLDDPRWLEPLVMAVGLAADARTDEEAARFLADFLGPDGPSRRPLPAAALVVAAAAGEMRRFPDAAAEEVSRQLLAAYAELEPPAPADVVERAFAALLAGPAAVPTERFLRRTLGDPADDRLARTAARLLAAVGGFSPEIVEALAEARPRDAPPWPIDRALRRVAVDQPSLLPAPRAGLRRSLERRPEHAARFLAEPAFRRIGLLVYGGLTDGGRFDLERIHREAPGVTRAVREVLEEGRPTASLVAACERMLDESPDDVAAALALVALGAELPRRARTSGVAAALEHAATELAAAPVRLEALGEPLARRIAELPVALGRDLAAALVAATPARDRRTESLLRLAERLPVAARPALLASFWAPFLTGARLEGDGRHDPIYSLAVVLDTAGALLADPPWVLAASLASAHRQAGGPDADAGPLLDLALHAIDALPETFDFARGWALAVLAPLFAASGRLGRAVELADRLSDRLGARLLALERLRSVASVSASDLPLAGQVAVQRLAPAPSSFLLDHEAGLLGPDRDPAALDALCHLQAIAFVTDARAAIDDGWVAPSPAPDSLDEVERDGLSSDTLPIVLERLEGGDDLDRHRAALALYGDASLTRRRSSARRLGLTGLRRLARAWLDRREERPRAALPLRWAFESVEHDDPELIRELVALAGGGDAAAGEAEFVLGDLHSVRGDVWPRIVEGLRAGAPAARRALLRSLTTLLARGRVPADRWHELASCLPPLAADFEGAVLLGGPGAIAEALDLPFADPAAMAEAVDRRYPTRAVSWPEVLATEPSRLRGLLTVIGEARLIGERYRLAVERAASRIVEQPPRLWVLGQWLSRRLTRDVSSFDRDDHLLRDLLAVTASAAARYPVVHAEGIERLESFDRKLSEATQWSDRFPSRQAALDLLSLGRRVTRHAVDALAAGLDDVSEVQRTALRSVLRYREVDPEVLPRLEKGLRAESPLGAYLTGRLVATLARNLRIDPAVRRRLTEALAAVIEVPESRRPLYLLTDVAEGRHGHRRRIEAAGRLDRNLHRLWARAVGLDDLFEPPAQRRDGKQ